jgi:aminopeptidase
VRVDREVELPAGVIRVAPIESSVSGAIVIPSARFAGVRVTGIRLDIEHGRIVRASAKTEEAALKQFLASAPGASQFREFGLGFNPKLVTPRGASSLPYYGYGAGVVRLSLGDSTEIGGSVRGEGARWFFFPSTTIIVGSRTIVRDGHLVER